MRTRLDNILMGILWLLAATLGTSFWFNTKYGFNIFSAQHWQYLAYLQASKTPVEPSFYISLGIVVFITIFGLYFLIQPKLRKIVFPIMKTKNIKVKTQSQSMTTAPDTQKYVESTTIQKVAEPQHPAENTVSNPPITPTAPTPTATTTATVTSHTVPLRPPRLNLQTANSYVSAPTITPVLEINATNNDADDAKIAEIFTENGYIVKKTPYINRWRPNLLAIGTNEVLWIGAVSASTAQVKKAIDKLNQIFSDTLDDVYIGINGFSINAPDAQTAEFNDILLFNTIQDLGEYMRAHPNTEPTTEEKDNFDAYSEYIDTVIGYIGNL